MVNWFKLLTNSNVGKGEIKSLPIDLHATLWPAFPHFDKFANNNKIAGLRLNSAMMAAAEIDDNFTSHASKAKIPLHFDIKGMQMRIVEVVCDETHDHLEFILNRPIYCKTPQLVYFKAGEDCAKLIEIKNGNHLIFERGPKYNVKVGESIHIKDPNLQVHGETFLPYEIEKIEKIKAMGFTRWYLSYVYEQRHVDEFRSIIGKDADLILKIENQAGLKYVSDVYKKTENTRLMAARGDLFIELDWPHEIAKACKTIVEKDPQAFVGSRMLLSVIHSVVPSCSDITELAGLYHMGYRSFLLCDELCLKDELLTRAVNVFDAFRKSYCM